MAERNGTGNDGKNGTLTAKDKRHTTNRPGPLDEIVGESPAIRVLRAAIERISRHPRATVLITGETGTGKELVANALHACSGRPGQPVKFNCSALPDGIFESELFGHRKGAFSGADETRKGLVGEAENGTLFLDEVSSLKLEHQAKLLRFLNDGSYMPLGEPRERKSNAWVIAATNNDLEQLSLKGQFRADLYYRLRVASIDIPALRQRREDIALLIEYFVTEAGRLLGMRLKRFTHDAHQLLSRYEWPGNVRQLKNFVTSLYMMDDGVLVSEQHVRSYFASSAVAESCDGNGRAASAPDNGVQNDLDRPVKTLKQVDKEHTLYTFEQQGRRLRQTARALGISRNTLRKRLIEYGIDGFD